MFTQSRSGKTLKLTLLALILIGIYLFIGRWLALEADHPAGIPDLAYDQWQHDMALELDRYDEPEGALMFYVSQRLPEDEKTLSPNRYEPALAILDSLPQFDITTGRASSGGRAAASAPWTELGPSNVGGRTRALLVDPNTPTTMYAAGVAGGVWKSTDGGSTWTVLDDFMQNLAVVSMAFDPGNSSTIYAGTGEGVFNIDAVRGDGIFKSTDAGATWTQLANTNDNSDFYYVMDIVVSPNNNSHVYAATRTGIWKSTDGGTNWTLSQAHSGANSRCTDLVIATTGPSDTVLASCGTFSIQGAIYRTTDGGANWTNEFSETNQGRGHLAIAPSNQNTIYALLTSTDGASNYDDGLHKVIRSTDGGANWTTRVDNTDPTLQNTLLLTNPTIACPPSPQYFNQGWYDSVIAVDPTNADVLWTGGIDLFKSTDGGANWAAASIWWNDANTWYVHADQHAIIFHPNYDGTTNETMFVANDGGIYRTNAAASGTTQDPCNVLTSLADFGWTNLNSGYNITQFYHGDTYPNGTSFFGGTQDNGTNSGTTASTSWTEIMGGDGGYVAVDPNNTMILYAETTNLSIDKSTDGGMSFASAISGITEASGNFLFINPFIMDPNNSSRLWTGGYTLWRTDDSAGSWTQASTTSLTGGGGNSISAWAVQPGNSDLVLAGDEAGNIYRNTSATTATSSTPWTDTASFGGYVSSIAFDPNTTSTVYATVSTFGATHLWRSLDSGASWAAFGGTLPDLPFHSVLVENGDSSRVYVGTDRGMILTTDGGTTWFTAKGMPRTPIEAMDLESDTGTEYLYAYTHGRGTLRAATPIPPTSIGLQTVQLFGLELNRGLTMTLALSVVLSTVTLFVWRGRRRLTE